MKIVIDIDDGLARYIRNDNSVPKKSDYELLVNAIYHGTPLPKGHGRLGDLDALEDEIENGIKAGLMIEGFEDYSNINNIDDCLESVKYATTIIEADDEHIECE